MNRWDVYWADFPYEEDPAQLKRRPVVVAYDNTVYTIGMRVTSQPPRAYDPYDYPLKYWQEAGLSEASVVRVRKLAQLKPDAIHDRIGRLADADIIEIIK